jgi:hypothetical protein
MLLVDHVEPLSSLNAYVRSDASKHSDCGDVAMNDIEVPTTPDALPVPSRGSEAPVPVSNFAIDRVSSENEEPNCPEEWTRTSGRAEIQVPLDQVDQSLAVAPQFPSRSVVPQPLLAQRLLSSAT